MYLYLQYIHTFYKIYIYLFDIFIHCTKIVHLYKHYKKILNHIKTEDCTHVIYLYFLSIYVHTE